MLGFSIMMWFVSAILIFVSISLLKGNYSFVHGKVFDTTDNKKGYAKELGKPVLFVGIGILVSGVIAIIVKNHSIPTAVFFLAIIAGIAGLWLHKIQKNFRKFLNTNLYLYAKQLVLGLNAFFLPKISDWSDYMNDIFKDMQAKVGCEYISDLPSYKRKVWQEMKRLNPADYEEKQLEDFSKYVFGMSYQSLKDVMKQQKGREEQCRKQGCWWKREEQLAKKQHHTGSTCR